MLRFGWGSKMSEISSTSNRGPHAPFRIKDSSVLEWKFFSVFWVLILFLSFFKLDIESESPFEANLVDLGRLAWFRSLKIAQNRTKSLKLSESKLMRYHIHQATAAKFSVDINMVLRKCHRKNFEFRLNHLGAMGPWFSLVRPQIGQKLKFFGYFSSVRWRKKLFLVALDRPKVYKFIFKVSGL